jgi:hypothetical protein
MLRRHRNQDGGAIRKGTPDMLHVDLPTRPEIRALAEGRGALSVSLYLPTSTVSGTASCSRT